MQEPSASAAAAHKTLFDLGIKCRREVTGDVYVDRALTQGSSDFAKPMQELVTEVCWGAVWTRTRPQTKKPFEYWHVVCSEPIKRARHPCMKSHQKWIDTY